MISYHIQPQRSHRGIWVNCLQSQAQRFVVSKSETYTRLGRKYRTTTSVGVCINLRDAEELARINTQASKPYGPGYKLGKRMTRAFV